MVCLPFRLFIFWSIVSCCSYGSWSEESKYEYKSWEDSSNHSIYSSIDRKALQTKMEENRRLALIEKQKLHEEAAKKAYEIWESSSTIGKHSYLEKKKIQAHGFDLAIIIRL